MTGPTTTTQGEALEARGVVISRELFDFLMGTGEVDGTWFGDLNANLSGQFWWRALLQTAQAAALQPNIDHAVGGVREACDFPLGASFSFHDEPGEHDPCYVVLPGGAMLALNHHDRTGVDIARAKFIISACNAALPDQPVKPASPDSRYKAALQAVEPYLDAIICYASTIDEHEGNRVAVLVRKALSAPQQPVKLDAVREALVAVAGAMLTGGDGAVGEFGWNITRLNKARPLILAALATPSTDTGLDPATGGWVVGSGDGKRWRTWKDGMSDWTDNQEEATRYYRRADAEAVHLHDEDAWTVKPYALASGDRS